MRHQIPQLGPRCLTAESWFLTTPSQVPLQEVQKWAAWPRCTLLEQSISNDWSLRRTIPTPSSLQFGMHQKGQPSFSPPSEIHWGGLCCRHSSASLTGPSCFPHSITGILRTLLKVLLLPNLHLGLLPGSQTKVSFHTVCWRSVALFQILSPICPFVSISTATAVNQATTAVTATPRPHAPLTHSTLHGNPRELQPSLLLCSLFLPLECKFEEGRACSLWL